MQKVVREEEEAQPIGDTPLRTLSPCSLISLAKLSFKFTY